MAAYRPVRAEVYLPGPAAELQLGPEVVRPLVLAVACPHVREADFQPGQVAAFRRVQEGDCPPDRAEGCLPDRAVGYQQVPAVACPLVQHRITATSLPGLYSSKNWRKGACTNTPN